MNAPELKVIAALRGKSIVPEIKPAKAIEKMKKFHAARPSKFQKLIEESNND